MSSTSLLRLGSMRVRIVAVLLRALLQPCCGYIASHLVRGRGKRSPLEQALAGAAAREPTLGASAGRRRPCLALDTELEQQHVTVSHHVVAAFDAVVAR